MKILLVDEQELILKTVRDFLKDLGHEVVAHASISDAIASEDQENRTPYDVIIMDPGEISERVLDEVDKAHACFPDTEVLLTGGADLKGPFELDRNLFAFLRKPVHLAELELLLTRILQKRA